MLELALAYLVFTLATEADAGLPPFRNISGDDWVHRGYADDFIRDVAAAAGRVGPEFGFRHERTGAFVAAHAVISSGYGRSYLAQRAYNLFGIKAGRTYTGRTLSLPGQEWCAGGRPAPECAGKPDGATVVVPTRWRVYESLDAVLREYFTKLGLPRYAASARVLRDGSEDYMAQLGRDGWYTRSPSEVGPIWQSGVRIVDRVLAGGSVHR